LLSLGFWLPLLGVGLVVGFIAGLFGMGGGAVIIPALLFVFGAQHFPPEAAMHQAVATSLACILLASITSMFEHHQHGAVDWTVVRRLAPGIVAGGLLGTTLVSQLPTATLKLLFMVFLLYVSINMLRPKAAPNAARELPGRAGMSLAGGVIGFVSALVGIGGAAISVPFMVFCNVRIHRAIGTSAALGFPIAASGTVGYVLGGWHQPGLAPYSLGYVHLPSVAALSAMSMLVAPMGARAAHRLPVGTLRKVYALFLLLVTARMAATLF